MKARELALVALSSTFLSCAVHAADVAVTGHIVQPVPKALDDKTLAGMAPPGFKLEKFAEGLINPRMLAVGPDGSVYVTRRAAGDVMMLKDTDGDGKADVTKVLASRPDIHGIAIDGATVYLATTKDVYRGRIAADGTFAQFTRIIDDLPDGGQHPNRTLGISPDKNLFISVGSTCNACAETNPENATILEAKPDGSSRIVFASGLRNTIGFAWHPQTGALYGFDHGIDWLGDDEQGEELNLLVKGKSYGWPYVYGESKINAHPKPPGNLDPQQWARMSEVPLFSYTAHAAPMQAAFAGGTQFPEAYRDDLFVAMRGSWNRGQPSGYEVVRVDFENGEPRGLSPFISGFVRRDGKSYAQYGRLAGLAFDKTGALLFTDDERGVIYRASYVGGDASGASIVTARRSTPAAQTQMGHQPTPMRLAAQILPTEQRIKVSSPTISNGEAIPLMHSAYDQDVAPALRWSAPAGTAVKSYVLLMEDPDAQDEPPFVHWIMYNIPSEVTELPHGIPALPMLQNPGGPLQGRNSRGTLGYVGMKPPVGNPPHRYHFQVFALDTMLPLLPGAGRKEVLDAMQGHTVAVGGFMGTFQAPARLRQVRSDPAPEVIQPPKR